jgi:hypothetical protein
MTTKLNFPDRYLTLWIFLAKVRYEELGIVFKNTKIL